MPTAAPADASGGIVGHEAERLAGGRFGDLDRVERIDAAGVGHLERERDVDRPERALVEPHHLSGRRRGDAVQLTGRSGAAAPTHA